MQFVDFSRIIVCKSRDIYLSATGTLRENKGTETDTMRLTELVRRFEESPAILPTHNTNPRLQTVCTDCTSIATELLHCLHRLEVPKDAKFRKWKSFRHALKSEWSKKKIDGIASKLSDLRTELSTEVFILLR